MTKKVKILSIILLAIAATAIVTVLSIFTRQKKSTIAFYGISNRQAEGIIKSLEKIIEEKNLLFDFKILESGDENLKKQLSEVRPAIIFVPDGTALDTAIAFADKKSEISEEKSHYGEMTTSIRGTVRKSENGITAVPILSDNLEVDIDNVALRSAEMTINTWEDIEKFAEYQKRFYSNPMIFAGGDSNLMLDIFGAFTEAFSGKDEYKNAVKIINDNSGKDFNAIKVAKLLTEENDAPLNKTVRFISKLYKNKTLPQNVFSLTKKDVEALVKAQLASVVIMSLDDHRHCDGRTMSRYSSIYFPSDFSAAERRFTSPVTFAVPLTKKFNTHEVISALTEEGCEAELSRWTGLAPVLNRAKTPDKQADLARYWVAGSNSPISGLSRDIHLTKYQKVQLCEELASISTRK